MSPDDPAPTPSRPDPPHDGGSTPGLPPAPLGALRSAAVAFVAGFAVMAAEMALARQIAPFFGSSQPVWAALISFVLLTVSAGCALGGRLSRAGAVARRAALLLAASGLALGLLGVVGPFCLSAAARLGRPGGLGAGIPALAGVIVLAATPLLGLGALPPLLVRATATAIEHAGVAAARVSAASTVGSLAGTLLVALVSLPLAGTRLTLIGLGAICAAAALLLSRRVWGAAPALAALAAASFVARPAPPPHPGVLLRAVETPYHAAFVVERADGRRELRLDALWQIHSSYDPRGPSRHGAWPAFLAAHRLRAGCARPPRRALVVGLAAGTVARDLSLAFPGIAIDGVEIDPELVALGRQYFDLPPATRVHIDDGRAFLAASEETYDLLLIDAYAGVYVPFHLATAELFALARRRLSPGGVLAVNAMAVSGEEALVDAVVATMRHVGLEVWTLAPPELYNVLVFGREPATPASPGEACAPLAHAAHHALVDRLAAQLRRRERDGGVVLTDDLAPVEALTHRLAWARLRRPQPAGGEE